MMQIYTSLVCSLLSVSLEAAEVQVRWQEHQGGTAEVNDVYNKKTCPFQAKHCHFAEGYNAGYVYIPEFKTKLVYDSFIRKVSLIESVRYHNITKDDVLLFNTGLFFNSPELYDEYMSKILQEMSEIYTLYYGHVNEKMEKRRRTRKRSSNMNSNNSENRGNINGDEMNQQRTDNAKKMTERLNIYFIESLPQHFQTDRSAHNLTNGSNGYYDVNYRNKPNPSKKCVPLFKSLPIDTTTTHKKEGGKKNKSNPKEAPSVWSAWYQFLFGKSTESKKSAAAKKAASSDLSSLSLSPSDDPNENENKYTLFDPVYRTHQELLRPVFTKSGRKFRLSKLYSVQEDWRNVIAHRYFDKSQIISVAYGLYTQYDSHVDGDSRLVSFRNPDCTHYCNPSNVFPYINAMILNKFRNLFAE